jgi:peptidoglycan hydrolase CwlO-like protein
VNLAEVVKVWEVIAKRWLRVVLVIVLVGIFVAGFLYFKRGLNAEKKALEQVIQRQEAQLKEKEMKIQELEAQLQELQKEQVLQERKIAELKKRRQEIKPPQTAGEVVKRFRELGYEVYEK